MHQCNQAVAPADCNDSDLASSSESESDVTDDEVYVRKHPRLSKKENQERKKQPRAGDFGDIQQKIISEADSYYRVLLSTVNTYPLPAQELDFVKMAWQ
jgi:hypothetical protein